MSTFPLGQRLTDTRSAAGRSAPRRCSRAPRTQSAEFNDLFRHPQALAHVLSRRVVVTGSGAGSRKEGFKAILETIGTMHRAEGQRPAGTDVEHPLVSAGLGSHDERKVIVWAGLPPMQEFQRLLVCEWEMS